MDFKWLDYQIVSMPTNNTDRLIMVTEVMYILLLT